MVGSEEERRCSASGQQSMLILSEAYFSSFCNIAHLSDFEKKAQNDSDTGFLCGGLWRVLEFI